MFVLIIFSSILVAEWPPFGKELLTPSTVCSPCILTVCNFSCFPFWGRNFVLFSPVPGHYIFVTFVEPKPIETLFTYIMAINNCSYGANNQIPCAPQF